MTAQRQKLEDMAQFIASALPKYIQVAQVSGCDELELFVAPSAILPVLTFLRDNSLCQFKVLADLCGVDVPKRVNRFEVRLLVCNSFTAVTEAEEKKTEEDEEVEEVEEEEEKKGQTMLGKSLGSFSPSLFPCLFFLFFLFFLVFFMLWSFRRVTLRLPFATCVRSASTPAFPTIWRLLAR